MLHPPHTPPPPPPPPPHFFPLLPHRFGHNIKIIHFIGSIKPWQHRYLKEVDAVILQPGTYAAQNAAQDYIRRWWQVYTSLEQQVRGDTGEGGGGGKERTPYFYGPD